MKITWAATMRADQGVRLPDEVWDLCKQSGLRRLLVGVESGSDEMLKRIRKDITIEQVFHTAREDARATASPGSFPFIVGFPDESDESIQATLDVRQAAARDEPGLPDADLLFQAVSRQRDRRATPWRAASGCPRRSRTGRVRLRRRACRGRGSRREKFRLIERFKFFHELAWNRHIAGGAGRCSGSPATAAAASTTAGRSKWR